jgi:hypothetical protein
MGHNPPPKGPRPALPICPTPEYLNAHPGAYERYLERLQAALAEYQKKRRVAKAAQHGLSLCDED